MKALRPRGETSSQACVDGDGRVLGGCARSASVRHSSRRRAVARLWLLPGVSKCPLQSWQRHGLDGERRREGYDCRILVSYQFGQKQEHRELGARKCTIWDPRPCRMSLPSAPPTPVASTSMQLVNFPDIVDLTFRILPGTSFRSKWSRLLWR